MLAVISTIASGGGGWGVNLHFDHSLSLTQDAREIMLSKYDVTSK